jgi:hypothetical protein
MSSGPTGRVRSMILSAEVAEEELPAAAFEAD